MKQGTNQWHEWRKMGICASDAPVIMGLSPYSNIHRLYKQKTGETEKEDGSKDFIFAKGHAMEEKARVRVELELDMDLPALLAVHKDNEWLRASLDGFNQDHMLVMECKYVGNDYFLGMSDGKLDMKDDHYCQIQHQLMVTGAEKCLYLLTTESPEDKSLMYEYFEVEVDLEYVEDMVKEISKFWHDNVLAKVAPEGQDPDEFVAVKDKDHQKLLSEWNKAQKKVVATKEKLKPLEADVKILEKQILALCDSPKMAYRNYQLIKGERIGSIEYAKIPELEGIDFELFRKPNTETFRIKVV